MLSVLVLTTANLKRFQGTSIFVFATADLKSLQGTKPGLRTGLRTKDDKLLNCDLQYVFRMIKD